MDLSVNYMGLKLKHPLMVGASPLVEDLDKVKKLEDAGASAVVMNSLFEEQILAEEDAKFRHEQDAVVSAEAASYFPDVDDFLMSLDKYLNQIAQIKKSTSLPVIASLNGVSVGGWTKYAKLSQEAGADALELNVYYLPTSPAETGREVENRTLEILKSIKDSVSIPVSVKLSPFISALPNYAHLLAEAGADGLVLFNRFYQPSINIEELEVASVIHFSDSSELLLRLRWLAILDATLPKMSFAATGGIHTAEGAIQAIMAGADALQMVSAVIRVGPSAIKSVYQGMVEWMEKHEYTSVDNMRGSMNLSSCPDASAFERANYMRVLRSWRP